MNNKPLRLARDGKRPGAGAKKIIDSQGSVVGYIKGTTLYDTGRYLSGDDACGYLDSNKNLFDLHGRYVGTIKRGLSINLGVAVLTIILLLTLLGFSLYYSSYIMGKIGLNVYNPEFPSITLTQDGKDWTQLENLDIFGGGADGNNENAYIKKAFIPGTIGSYSFVLKNDTESAIQYNLLFKDENIYRIPMRFRLLSSNAYIVGAQDKWVTINELKCSELLLLQSSSTLFTIEWKWAPDIDDKADTDAGQASAATYTLNIQIDATVSNVI